MSYESDGSCGDARRLAELSGCRGALAHLATPDAEARRRKEDDADAWRSHLLAPFRVDCGKVMRCKMVRRLANKSLFII